MKTRVDHEKLDVYQEAIRFVSWVDDLLGRIPKSLADCGNRLRLGLGLGLGLGTLPAISFLLLASLATRAQEPETPYPVRTDVGVVMDGQVYPTNFDTIHTPQAGILGLRAIDIPRHTQTGPIPDPPPERLWVLPPMPRDPALPTIWTIGDSTVRCGVNATGDDKPGQWGWGTPFVGYVDPHKVNVVNRAVGGTTTASFYNSLWKDTVDLLQPGDLVIIQFGTNSGRGEMPGIGTETRETTGPDGEPATEQTFGHYLRRFIAETRAHGATPIVCSLIPRNRRGPDGNILRHTSTQAGWARQVATAAQAAFIDLNELVARQYDAMNPTAVDALFAGSPHTNWAGAVLNAETVIAGLKALSPDPAAPYYLPNVAAIPPASP